MAYPSKEEKVLELFFNEATKHWCFKDIVNAAKVSEFVANKWLKKYCSDKLINKIKPKRKMPYYIANWDNLNYHIEKRFYALNKLHDSGLIYKLQSLKKAKTIVIFGSFVRTDWHTKSDVDIFILGNPENLRFGAAWTGLGMQGKSREISVHSYPTLQKIKNIRSGLIKNVVKGFFVKGNVNDLLGEAS